MPNKLKVLDVLDVTAASTLPTSALFYLEPIGIGSADVESLSSYFARLALAHYVKPTVLLDAAIIPEIARTNLESEEDPPQYYLRSDLHSAFDHMPTNINGINSSTRHLITALENLTNIGNLRLLTMVPYANVISGLGLVRTYAAWCPACYQEELEKEQPVYDSLVWSLTSIEICAHHNVVLQRRCPFADCQHPLKRLNPTYQPGYCYYCNRWLGHAIQPGRHRKRKAITFNYDEFRSQEVCNLFDTITQLQTRPKDVNLSHAIQTAVQITAEGSIPLFQRSVSLSDNLVRDLCNGNVIPRLEQLLKICYKAGISFHRLVTKGEIEITSDAKMARRKTGQKINRKQIDHHKCEELLKPFLTCVPPLSLKKIATILKTTEFTLKRHYPALVIEIAVRHNQFVANQATTKYLAVRFGLEELLSQPIESSISVSEIVRNSGINNTYLWRHCRDLCKQLAERHQLYQAQETLKKQAEKDRLIRDIAISLSNQGIYPTQLLVDKLLDKPLVYWTPRHREILNDVRVKHVYR